jgi:hypothetical protein
MKRWKLDLDLDRHPTLARWRTLSRGGQVAVAAVVVLLAWLALEQWSWSWARAWTSEAERIELALSDSRALASAADPVAVKGAELFGPVEPPVGESEGAEAMAKAVVEVVKRHAHSNFSYDAQRASSSLPGAPVMIGGSGQRLSKVTGEVQFEASPEEAARIIEALEASPAIEAISSMRLQRRDGERKVMVRLTVEAWVYAARRGGRMG